MSQAAPARILMVRTDRMGDVILSTPVIRALRSALPQAYLGMMVRPEHRELVEGHPDLNVVIPYDKKGRERSGWGSLRFALRLKAHRFDTALILHSTNRVILVTWAAGIRRRIGYARRLPWLLTERLPYFKREGQRHELDYNLELLKFLRVEAKERTLSVSTTPAQESKVQAFLEWDGTAGAEEQGTAGAEEQGTAGADEQGTPRVEEQGTSRVEEHRTPRVDGQAPLIVLHPGASCPSKRWPPERFASVADQLIRRYRARVAVVTGPEETHFGEAVVGQMTLPALRAFGTLSLGELACLLRQARCLISNDSGPIHLACAVGTPVVAIFGRWGGGLSPTRWGPTDPRSVVLHHDVGCRPCLAHRCPIGFLCLKAVTVEEVLAAVEQVLVTVEQVASLNAQQPDKAETRWGLTPNA